MRPPAVPRHSVGSRAVWLAGLAHSHEAREREDGERKIFEGESLIDFRD